MVCQLAAEKAFFKKTARRQAAQFINLFRKTAALKLSFEYKKNASHYHLHQVIINWASESMDVGLRSIVQKI